MPKYAVNDIDQLDMYRQHLFSIKHTIMMVGWFMNDAGYHRDVPTFGCKSCSCLKMWTFLFFNLCCLKENLATFL